MTFHVGQKVVCVDDVPPMKPGVIYLPWDHKIARGEVYVVRWIGDDRDETCVRLQGVYRNYYGADTPYFANRFRPVVERKTNISIFTEMLTPSTPKVNA